MKHERGGELQRKNLEAAVRLAELSVDNTLRIMLLLTELARTLFEESLANAEARATAVDVRENMRLRAEHARQTMRLMTETAQEIVAVGADVRARFSRLLTEQLASGSHELMDTFQSFFKVLPARNPEFVEAVERAIARGQGAIEQITAAAFGDVREETKEAHDMPRRQRSVMRQRRASSAGAVASHPVEPRAY